MKLQVNVILSALGVSIIVYTYVEMYNMISTNVITVQNTQALKSSFAKGTEKQH